MRLVYKSSAPPSRAGMPVQVGDVCMLSDGQQVKVAAFREPTSPASSGRVVVKPLDAGEVSFGREYYVSVIHAEWIEREDQGPENEWTAMNQRLNFDFALKMLRSAQGHVDDAILREPTGEVRNAMTDVNIKLMQLIEDADKVLAIAKKADV